MKKLVFLSLLVPVFAKAQFTIVNTSTVNLAETRPGGAWPLNLKRDIKESDTSYLLEFRDEQNPSGVDMSTLRFRDVRQVKYFQEGLSALKTAATGTTVKYKDYTIKRVDVTKESMDIKKPGVWYCLTILDDGSLTNFQQPEADQMIEAVKNINPRPQAPDSKSLDAKSADDAPMIQKPSDQKTQGPKPAKGKGKPAQHTSSTSQSRQAASN